MIENEPKRRILCIRENPALYIHDLCMLVEVFAGPYMSLRREETCLPRFANNKGADQPAHMHSLICAFDIRILENIISELARNRILIFEVDSLAEQAGLGMTW